MIRVGLAGYGLAGSVFHAPLIRACRRMELTAVLTSRDVPLRVDDVDALFDRCDLLVIATPNSTHAELATAAINAGKHVVVDKPFMVTPAQADAVIDLARRKGRLLTVFHNRRWDSDFLTVRKLLPTLGEISLFEAHWDRFRPAIKPGWREVPAPGSGVLNDLGAHMIDQALELFGMPSAVSADVVAQRAGAGVDDYFDVTLHYGVQRVCLRCSTLIAAPRPRFAMHGSGGSFVKFGLDPQESQLKNGMDANDPLFGHDPSDGVFTLHDGSTATVATERGNYRAFYEAVANSLIEGSPAPVDPASARDGLMIIDLARRASALGQAPERGQRLPVPDANSPEESSPQP